MYAIRFDIHNKQDEVTYMSPVEVLVIGIVTFNQQKLSSLIARSFPSAILCPGIKNLPCSNDTNAVTAL